MRWQEEKLLMSYEMCWTWLFFENKAKEWNRIHVQQLDSGIQGGSAYAAKQRFFWQDFSSAADEIFSKQNPTFKEIYIQN